MELLCSIPEETELYQRGCWVIYREVLSFVLGNKSEFTTDEWLSHIQTIQKTQSLKDLSEVFIESVGCKTAISYNIPSIGSKERQTSDRFFHYKMPKEVTSYMKASYSTKLDPVAQYVLDLGKAIWVSDVVELPSFVQTGCDKFVKSLIALVGDGICVPIFHKTHWGYHFINFGRPKEDFSETHLWQIQSLCQHCHVQYVLLTRLLKEKIKLTNRELSVIELMTMGKTNNEIAIILGITTHTVHGYVKNIYLKLDVNDRVTATLRAMSLNLVS